MKFTLEETIIFIITMDDHVDRRLMIMLGDVQFIVCFVCLNVCTLGNIICSFFFEEDKHWIGALSCILTLFATSVQISNAFFS